jgi:hypothetical protein
MLTCVRAQVFPVLDHGGVAHAPLHPHAALPHQQPRAAAGHRDHGVLHPVHPVGGGAHRVLGAALGPVGQRERELPAVRQRAERQGPEHRGAGVAGAEEHLPELDGGLGVPVGRGGVSAVDDDHGVSGV